MAYYALSDRAVNQFKNLLEPKESKILTGESAGASPLRFVKLTEAAPAAAANQVGKSAAQLYTWDPDDNPATLGINELNTINVWNPHDVEIPSGTLCIIGKFPQGWVIIAPVNWCPPAE